MKDISRKKFLRVCGSIVAGGAVAGVSGVLAGRGLAHPAPGSGTASSEGLRLTEGNASVSPYRLASSFDSSGIIQAFEQFGDKIYVAASNTVSVSDAHGKLLRRFAAREETIRDIAVNNKEVYLLHPAKVSVYSPEGAFVREWEACSDLSNYCSFALAPGFVFVTDMENKNICQYTDEGNFVRFINSPNKFIIPSPTFGIEYTEGVIYCSNSGRHQVESYTLDGRYTGSFGKPGGSPGRFAGCCNPVHLSCTPNGDVITSEKGNPRISCYGNDGTFRSVLLDSKALGGGHAAYDVKVRKDKIFVAGKNKVSVFQYDKTLAANTGACSACGIECPLRT